MKRWLRVVLFACLGPVGAGCASGNEVVNVSPLDVPAPGVRPSSGAEQLPPNAIANEDEGPAVLTREVLTRAIARGFGSFLTRVDVTPMFTNGRFVGFRLDRARDLRRWNAAGLDLRVGDVVTRVNGRSVERPEMAAAVFASMREAPEVQVELIRAGAPVTVRLAVQGDAPATAAAATTAR